MFSENTCNYSTVSNSQQDSAQDSLQDSIQYSSTQQQYNNSSKSVFGGRQQVNNRVKSSRRGGDYPSKNVIDSNNPEYYEEICAVDINNLLLPENMKLIKKNGSYVVVLKQGKQAKINQEAILDTIQNNVDLTEQQKEDIIKQLQTINNTISALPVKPVQNEKDRKFDCQVVKVDSTTTKCGNNGTVVSDDLSTPSQSQNKTVINNQKKDEAKFSGTSNYNPQLQNQKYAYGTGSVNQRAFGLSSKNGGSNTRSSNVNSNVNGGNSNSNNNNNSNLNDSNILNDSDISLQFGEKTCADCGKNYTESKSLDSQEINKILISGGKLLDNITDSGLFQGSNFVDKIDNAIRAFQGSSSEQQRFIRLNSSLSNFMDDVTNAAYAYFPSLKEVVNDTSNANNFTGGKLGRRSKSSKSSRQQSHQTPQTRSWSQKQQFPQPYYATQNLKKQLKQGINKIGRAIKKGGQPIIEEKGLLADIKNKYLGSFLENLDVSKFENVVQSIYNQFGSLMQDKNLQESFGSLRKLIGAGNENQQQQQSSFQQQPSPLLSSFRGGNGIEDIMSVVTQQFGGIFDQATQVLKQLGLYSGGDCGCEKDRTKKAFTELANVQIPSKITGGKDIQENTRGNITKIVKSGLDTAHRLHMNFNTAKEFVSTDQERINFLEYVSRVLKIGYDRREIIQIYDKFSDQEGVCKSIDTLMALWTDNKDSAVFMIYRIITVLLFIYCIILIQTKFYQVAGFNKDILDQTFNAEFTRLEKEFNPSFTITIAMGIYRIFTCDIEEFTYENRTDNIIKTLLKSTYVDKVRQFFLDSKKSFSTQQSVNDQIAEIVKLSVEESCVSVPCSLTGDPEGGIPQLYDIFKKVQTNLIVAINSMVAALIPAFISRVIERFFISYPTVFLAKPIVESFSKEKTGDEKAFQSKVLLGGSVRGNLPIERANGGIVVDINCDGDEIEGYEVFIGALTKEPRQTKILEKLLRNTIKSQGYDVLSYKSPYDLFIQQKINSFYSLFDRAKKVFDDAFQRGRKLEVAKRDTIDEVSGLTNNIISYFGNNRENMYREFTSNDFKRRLTGVSSYTGLEKIQAFINFTSIANNIDNTLKGRINFNNILEKARDSMSVKINELSCRILNVNNSDKSVQQKSKEIECLINKFECQFSENFVIFSKIADIFRDQIQKRNLYVIADVFKDTLSPNLQTKYVFVSMLETIIMHIALSMKYRFIREYAEIFVHQANILQQQCGKIVQFSLAVGDVEQTLYDEFIQIMRCKVIDDSERK